MGDRRGLLTVLFLTVLCGLWSVQAYSTGDGKKSDLQRMMAALHAAEAQPDRASMHYGSEYEPAADKTQLQRMGNEISRALDLEPKAAVTYSRRQKLVYENSRTTKGERLTIRLIGWRHESSQGPYRTYLVVRFTDDDPNADAMDDRLQQMKKGLSSVGVLPHFNTSVRAFWDDILKTSLQNKKISLILSNLNADTIEQMADQTAISVSAYTTDIKYAIETNGVKMNVQVATHVDQVRRRTGVTVGTPIITEEY